MKNRGFSKGPSKNNSSKNAPPKRAPQRPNQPQRRPHSGPDPRLTRDNARWVVGIHSCAEAIRVRPGKIREVLLKEGWADSQQLRELQELALSKRIQIRERSHGQLEQVGMGNQGIAVACTESPEVDWENLKEAESAVVLLLDGIEDPHNLGSMLRTSWLTGVSAIFIPTDRAVGLTPAACKVASGGAEHVPVESEPNLASVMERLKEIGFWIYGLAEAGERAPWQFDLPKKVAWVIGAEGSGMRKATERACDELVRIPQVASGSSYNASIAAAIALADTVRQHGSNG